MTFSLPDSLLVLERGWLSANNILFFEGDEATLVDSGYVTHADQTVDLVGHALRGRRLKRLINTHSHSDHIGGNAALQVKFGCKIVVPAGLHASIAEWDENAHLFSPLGQQAMRSGKTASASSFRNCSARPMAWPVPGRRSKCSPACRSMS